MNEYKRMQHILYGAESNKNDGAFAQSLHDICVRFKKMASKKTFDRFIKDMDDYLYSVVWESQQRNNEVIPDLKTYIEKRALTGAMLAEFDFIELAQRCEVPDEILDNEPMKSVIDKANNAINWFNDINGIKRDFATGSVFSIVTVIKNQFNLSWKDALQKAVDLHNEAVKEFIRLSKNLPSFGQHDDSVHKYIDGLCIHDQIKYGDSEL
ncbi:MAG: terpene synthase family protein [Legionella sp.]